MAPRSPESLIKRRPAVRVIKTIIPDTTPVNLTLPTHLRRAARRALIATLLAAPVAAPRQAAAQGPWHFTYQPATEAIANPERGIFTHQEIASTSGYNLTAERISRWRSQGLSLVFLGFRMEAFRTAPISEAYLQRVRQNLELLRTGGIKAVVRFCYSYSESDHPWDVPWTLSEQHIRQLTPILREYSDVITVLEAGFVGVWGEWYYTDNYNFEPRPQDYGPRRTLLRALLDAMPSDRTVAVRYPAAKLNILQCAYTDTISAATAYDGSERSRIAFHNDGFLADADDYGTFQYDFRSRYYWQWESRFVPVGGETAKMSNFCNVANARQAMADYHWSYINQDYHQDVVAMWRAAGFLDEVARNIGYRFVLADADVAQSEVPGRDGKGSVPVLNVAFTVRNDGWAAPYNPRGLQLILQSRRQSRRVFCYDLMPDPLGRPDWTAERGGKHGPRGLYDPRHWQPGQAYRPVATISLAGVPEDDYDVCLYLPDGRDNLYARPDYAIRMANAPGMWQSSTGYNVLGTVRVGTSGANASTTPAAGSLPAFRRMMRPVSVWAGCATSGVTLGGTAFAVAREGDALQFIYADGIEHVDIDAKLLRALQSSGQGFPTSGRTLRAVNLLLAPPADDVAAAIAAPHVDRRPAATYDVAPFIRIENGRKVFRKR